MRKSNRPKRLRKKKTRKRRKSNYPESVRLAVERQRAQVDAQRTEEFHRQIINQGISKGDRAFLDLAKIVMGGR